VGCVVDKMVLRQIFHLTIILPMFNDHRSSKFVVLGTSMFAVQRSNLNPILQLRELSYK